MRKRALEDEESVYVTMMECSACEFVPAAVHRVRTQLPTAHSHTALTTVHVLIVSQQNLLLVHSDWCVQQQPLLHRTISHNGQHCVHALHSSCQPLCIAIQPLIDRSSCWCCSSRPDQQYTQPLEEHVRPVARAVLRHQVVREFVHYSSAHVLQFPPAACCHRVAL